MESLQRATEELDRNEGETEDLFDVAFWFVAIFQENRSFITEVDKLTGKTWFHVGSQRGRDEKEWRWTGIAGSYYHRSGTENILKRESSG